MPIQYSLMSATTPVLFVNGLTIWVSNKDFRGHVSHIFLMKRFVYFIYYNKPFNLIRCHSRFIGFRMPTIFFLMKKWNQPGELPKNICYVFRKELLLWNQGLHGYRCLNKIDCRNKIFILFLFQLKALQGSADFFALNHYTTFLMSPSSMEPDWQVPSWDQDTGVRVEQNLTWPRPGADWLTVSLEPLILPRAFVWRIVICRTGIGQDTYETGTYDRRKRRSKLK